MNIILSIMLCFFASQSFAANKKVQKESARAPSEWTSDEKGKLVTAYKGKVTAAFIKEANKKNSLVKNDMSKVIAEYDASAFGGCGGVSFPEKITEAAIIVTPYNSEGFYGRHCVGQPTKDCDTQDDEGFLILIPYTSSCTRSTEGSTLIYRMTYRPSFNGGKDKYEGPVGVKISAEQ